LQPFALLLAPAEAPWHSRSVLAQRTPAGNRVFAAHDESSWRQAETAASRPWSSGVMRGWFWQRRTFGRTRAKDLMQA